MTVTAVIFKLVSIQTARPADTLKCPPGLYLQNTVGAALNVGDSDIQNVLNWQVLFYTVHVCSWNNHFQDIH